MAAKKSALGKGLSALLPSQPGAPDAEGEEGLPRTRLYNFDERQRLAGRVADVEIESIRPNPYQPRKDFDEAALDELADSIRQLGVIQPLTVRSTGRNQYELISGERRLRASRRAGLKMVPAYVREATTEEILEMAIVENVQREDLNPVEIALGYQRLTEEVGLTQEQVAEKVSKSRSAVANTLRLLKLPPRVQASLREGTVTAGHARMLVALDDEDAQLALHREIVDDGLSVREVERRVRAMRRSEQDAAADPSPVAEKAEKKTQALSPRDRLQIEKYESDLRERFATQVQIRHRPSDGAGSITIAYYSAEDLERVIEALRGQ